MTKELAFSLAATIALCALGRTAVAGSPLKRETGCLQELIARLGGSDYVLGEPTSDRRPYVNPGPALHAFRHLATALAWGDVHEAARKAAKLDYEVVRFTDKGTQNQYFVLREDLGRGQTCRGWGSYIINPDNRIDALVEVPHPLADAQTPEIGGLVFEQAEAKGFLLAGAHRDKADVPDLVDSVFHQVHTAWVGPAARVAAWQIHGFASYKHSFPRGVHVVASAGDGVIIPELANLDAMFEDRGMTSYVFNDRPPESRANKRLNGDVPGITFSSLAAADNEQGRLSRSLGGSFVHIELESSVRLNAAQRDTAAAVIASAMSGGSSRVAETVDEGVTLASLESDVDLAEGPASTGDEDPTATADHGLLDGLRDAAAQALSPFDGGQGVESLVR